ncbi:MAG: hypothetical protein ABIJ43_05845 [Candidatus Beckwithbacteria bacterium]|uniref:Uncharacterized protein n=1 Tax=viral metagenome TaxID=1070528 RepID=A0A6M3JX95_9ZZZZ
MNIYLGETGLDRTWQESFKPTTECKCGGEARIMFVAIEETREGDFVCNLRDNGGEGDFWPHDAIACAVYLCKKCFEPITIINQA